MKTGQVMENKSSPDLTLPLLLIAALCLEAAVIERYLYCPTEKKNWTDARMYCQKNFIDLAYWNMVDGSTLASWLVDIEVTQVWIGLHRDPQNYSVWKWINVKTGKGLDDLLQSSYGAGQQSSLCAFVASDLMWHSDVCWNTHSVYCSQGDNIYYYKGSFTWNDAYQFCQVMNSDLATITNTNSTQLYNTGWIGLYQDTDNNWRWIKNQPFSYTNWAPGEPLTADCGSFYATNTWYSNMCSQELRLVCYYDNLVVVNENKTWEEALSHCNSMKTPCDDSSGSCIYQYQLLSLQQPRYYSYVRDRIYTATTDEVGEQQEGGLDGPAIPRRAVVVGEWTGAGQPGDAANVSISAEILWDPIQI